MAYPFILIAVSLPTAANIWPRHCDNDANVFAAKRDAVRISMKLKIVFFSCLAQTACF